MAKKGQHHTLPTAPPPPPIKEEKTGNLWQRLSTEGKVSTVLGILTLLACLLVIPEVRYALHLEKRPEERTTQPQTPPVGEPQNQSPTPAGPQENQPAKPKLRYVPLPNAVPLDDEHKQLLTSLPKDDKDRKSVVIDGKAFDVLSTEDIDKLVIKKDMPSGFVKLSGGNDVQLYVGIDKYGAVKNVQVISGDEAAGQEAADAVKKWKFRPFKMGNGDPVAVQTVIDFDKKLTEKQE